MRLSYDVFKGIVVEKLPMYLPEKYREADWGIESARIKDDDPDEEGFCIIRMKKGEVIRIHLKNLYEEYLKDGDVRSVFSFMAQIIDAALEETVLYLQEPAKNRSRILGGARFLLVSRERNKEMLDKAVWRPFLDMAVIYGVYSDMGKVNIVSREMLDNCNITEDELFAAASQNTEEAAACSPLEKYLSVDEQVSNAYILTNQEETFGAGTVMIQKILDAYCQNFGADLYLFPSSVHEFILEPVIGCVADMAEEDLRMLIRTVNGANKPGTYLSGHVYRYGWKTHEFSVAA